MVFHTSIVNWGVEGEYMYPQYMCILPYVKCIWCNGIPYIFGVTVFHRSIVNWSGGLDVSSVFIHSAIVIWCNGIPYIYCQLGC